VSVLTWLRIWNCSHFHLPSGWRARRVTVFSLCGNSSPLSWSSEQSI